MALTETQINNLISADEARLNTLDTELFFLHQEELIFGPTKPIEHAIAHINAVETRIATQLNGLELLLPGGDVLQNITTSKPNGDYLVGSTIDIELHFSGPVIALGKPHLSLNSGGEAIYSSGSRTDTLTFEYTVGATDTTNNALLDVTGLKSGSIEVGGPFASQHQAATLNFVTAGEQGALGTNSDITIGPLTGPPLHPLVVDFENLSNVSGAGQPLANPYEGFVWTTPHYPLYVLDASTTAVTGSGYQVGSVAGGHIVAYTPFADQPVDIHEANNGVFQFQSVYLTPAWDSFLGVTLTGYRNGQVVGQVSAELDNLQPTLVHANWGLIDDLKVSTGTGILDARWVNIAGVGNHLVMDHFSFLA